MKRIIRCVLGGVVVVAIVAVLAKRNSSLPGQNLPTADNSTPLDNRGPSGSATPPVITNAATANSKSKFGINPYAGALREPGTSKRSWDLSFMREHQRAAVGDAIEFELTDGKI